MVDEVVGKARQYFMSKYNCAQSVLKSVLEHKGLLFDEATNLAAGFGGGMSHSGQACGAVSGAIMAIGVLVGQEYYDVKKHKQKNYDRAEEFIKHFKNSFGTIVCDELTNVNMSDRDALEKALKEGIFEEICPKFVDKAVEIILNMFPD